MHALLRNSSLAFLLLIIVVSAVKCGSSTDEHNVPVSEVQSTYKNLSTDVKYVGSTPCRQCHYDKFETFHETGMGRSFDGATKTKSSGKFENHPVVYDKFSNLSYHPFWSGDSMKILEFRLEGKDTAHRRIETVHYIVGSGQHTNSHISNTNGYLHQMPLTFYTQKGTWDLPPGFENGYNSRFSRKIGLECMSCHNSLPEFVMGSENKFNAVGKGIGCERCHGPGEIHVKEKTAGIVVDTSKEIDYSIVNPGKLTADLQFDLCQRCHLQGNAVLKDGKSFFDFRPGMKLSDVMTVFLPKYEGADDEFIMASHADRLKMSSCFIKSGGRSKESGENSLRPYKNGMTCVTCHNPHVSVKATDKDVFNNACKNCHSAPAERAGGNSCSEKIEVRNKVQDNCVSCHMPRSGSIDIPHVTVTDHFIRKPVEKKDVAAIKKFIGLVAVNEKNPDPRVKAEAYINQFEKFGNDPALLDSAKKYLDEKAISDFYILVRLYFLKKDFSKILALDSAFAQYEWINTTSPSYDNKDAWTLYRIAEAYQYFGKTGRAFKYYKEAAALAPYNPELLNKLAGNLIAQNKIPEAQKLYEKIISENPKYAPAWCNLGYIYLQTGNTGTAMELYNKAISLDPDYEQALINKAGLLVYEKKNSQAFVLVKRILKLNPRNEQALALQKRLNK